MLCEDALSWRLAQAPSCSEAFAAPGNAGTTSRGENWADVAVTDGKAIARRAREKKIDLAVLDPETAIAAGVGAYSPPVGFPADMHEIVQQHILDPVLRGLRAEGERYVGVLYSWLMLTDTGPR